MDCSSITDFQQSTAIRIAKKFRNLHIGQTGQTKLAFKLDFPGNLCRAAFAILATFFILPSLVW